MASEEQWFFIGIGASAGGIEALERFFLHIPSDSNLSYIIIQHLSPNHKSMLNKILEKNTNLPIHEITNGMTIQPKSIYLGPPGMNVEISKQELFLSDIEQEGKPYHPINHFFESLANEKKEKSIGIILSGTGVDGTVGVKAIKEQMGMVIGQSLASSKFEGMPRSVIATGMADFICEPEKMGEILKQYIKNPLTNYNYKEIEIPKDQLLKILDLLLQDNGVDFTQYKDTTLIRRIAKRISLLNISDIQNYYDYIIYNPSELRVLYHELLIGVTRFFRDSPAFAIIADKIIPEIFTANEKSKVIRIWIPGCSTGEEVYSLAILFKEYMEKIKAFYEIKIFATDVDRRAITFAGLGIYDKGAIAEVSQSRLNQFFVATKNGYKVVESIRKMVVFAVHNVMSDPPFSKIDMISCRNLLIYIKSELQAKILDFFVFSLNQNGYLFLGSSESTGNRATSFEIIEPKWKIFQFKGGRKPLIGDKLDVHSSKLPTYNTELVHRVGNEYVYINEIQNIILDDYLNSAILISQNFELIHVYGDISKFLIIPAGGVSFNVINMIRKELAVALSTSVQNCLKESKTIKYVDLSIINEHDNLINLDLIAKPIAGKNSETKFVLITFEEKGKRKAKIEEIEKFNIEENYNNTIKQLELDIQKKQEFLQATTEEMESSNEELQTSNEELLASNEELQSTNEELQSVNEELNTINLEYHYKISELSQVSSDMNTLLELTNIGIIYLDHELKIRKFSPTVTKIINVIDSDINRPFSDITHNLNYETFNADILEVTQTKQLLEKRVHDIRDRTEYIIKIIPSGLPNNQNGFIITFIKA